MNILELIDSINLTQNCTYTNLSQIFNIIIQKEGTFSKQEIDSVVGKIIDCLTVDFNLLDDLAKINILENEVKNFEAKCESILKDLDQLNHTKNSKIIMHNVISGINYKIIDLKNGSENNNRTRIKINQDVTLLLAFMKAMREEFTEANTISDYRLAQLVSDNFNNKEGKQINLNYCKNKFSTGNGIAINDNQRLKAILNNILNKIS